YLQLKTGKKLSEKLLCVQLIHLTDLQLSPLEAFY
ncbi:nef attachable domain protein, partial [Chlamydia psittaci 02DC14]